MSVQPIICQKTGNAQKTENDHDRFVRVCQSVFPSTGVDEGVVYDPLLAMPFTAAQLGFGLCMHLLSCGLLKLGSGRWDKFSEIDSIDSFFLPLCIADNKAAVVRPRGIG